MPSLLSFKVNRPVSLRTLASAVGVSAPISLRAIMQRLADPRRPFYLIAHRCNDLQSVIDAVAAGANAIECDIQFTDNQRGVGGIEFVVNHDNDWTEVSDDLVPYLAGVVKVLRDNPKVALWIFDLKDDDPADAVRLRNTIRKHLTDHVPINVILSQADYASRGFFEPIKGGLRRGEGYAIDQHNHPDSVSDFFVTSGIDRHGYGNGIFQVGGGEHVTRSIMSAVAQMWTERRIRWVYVWTIIEKSTMRNYIALGLDGIMVNEVADLRSVLEESAIKKQVVLATRARDPFVMPPYLPAYVLTVKTASAAFSGTDSDVTFELHGADGVATTRIDASPPFIFESEGTDQVTLIGTDVGAITKLVITNHGDVSGDWTVNSVAVRKSGAAAVTVFDFFEEIPSGGSASRAPA
jgi:glycerophosphoryl diester phosphodiesterase